MLDYSDAGCILFHHIIIFFQLVLLELLFVSTDIKTMHGSDHHMLLEEKKSFSRLLTDAGRLTGTGQDRPLFT